MQRHGFQSAFALEAYGLNRCLWDTPLFESENFSCVPSVGALVEGWLLVVPKNHALSCSRIGAGHRNEFASFVETVATALQLKYGVVSLFEHGAGRCRSSIGCGVDYAHLHLVPNCPDLLR